MSLVLLESSPAILRLEPRANNAANAAFAVSPTPAPDMSHLGAQPGRIARRNQNTVLVCWVDTFRPAPDSLSLDAFIQSEPSRRDLTFGAVKFQYQKKFWLRVNRPSGLSPGVLIRPALFAALRLVH